MANDLCRRATVRHLEHGAPAVRGRFVRAEHAKVGGIELDHVADELALDARGFAFHGAGLRHVHRVIAKIRQAQVAQQEAAVGVRIGAHAALAFRGQFREFGTELAGLVEQLLRAIALHPLFQNLHMPRMAHLAHRHLVRAERALGRFAIDHLRAGPALRRAQDHHGPARSFLEPIGAGVVLDALNLGDRGVERGGHELVHLHRVVALDEIGRVTVAAKERFQFVAGNAGQHGGAGNLVAVQVQDGQHGAVVDRIEKLVRMPTGGERAGLRFAIADDARDEQVGIIERRPVGVRQRIAQLAAFVNRAGRLRRDVARDAAGEGELLEQPLHPVLVL